MINGKDDPPNLDKIIKLMGMTGSSHDPEAISALRMATELMRKWGWTWEAVLRGKVKIMPDPFAAIPMPTATAAAPRYQAAPPPPPRQYDNRVEIEKWFDKVNMPGRKIPHDIAQRLAAIERTWGAQGFLIHKDWDFLRIQANKRRY